MTPSKTLRMMVFSSLFAALTAAGAYIAIPVGPVPIVLQNFFILLAGLLLGRKWGAAAIGIYLFAGACGLPVFAGGTGGIAHFAGPTGGYLIGFLGTAYGVGFISERTRNTIFWDVIAMICGMTITYVCGITWLTVITGLSLAKAMTVGFYPFLPGTAIKIAAAIPVVKALRPVIGKNR